MPAGDIATTKQFTSGQLGVDAPDLNAIVGQASIQPGFYSAQTSAAGPGVNDLILLLQAGGAYAKCLYSNFFTQAAVRAVLGQQSGPTGTLINGDMAVWQRNTTFTGPANGAYTADRYVVEKVLTTRTINVTQLDLAGGLAGGTFNSQPRYALRVTASAAETSVPAGDVLNISQRVERQRARMLFDNVSSLSVW